MPKLDISPFLGKCIWSEDDALPHDRERLPAAWERITGSKWQGRSPLLTVDGGDCLWELYQKYVVCTSFPGQTAIYERKS